MESGNKNKCPKCGAQLSIGSEFCSNCGISIKLLTLEPYGVSEAFPKIVIALWVFGVLAILGGIIPGIILLGLSLKRSLISGFTIVNPIVFGLGIGFIFSGILGGVLLFAFARIAYTLDIQRNLLRNIGTRIPFNSETGGSPQTEFAMEDSKPKTERSPGDQSATEKEVCGKCGGRYDKGMESCPHCGSKNWWLSV